MCSADCKFVAKSSPGTEIGGLMSPISVFFSLVNPRTSPDLECPDRAFGPQPSSAQVPIRSTLKARPHLTRLWRNARCRCSGRMAGEAGEPAVVTR